MAKEELSTTTVAAQSRKAPATEQGALLGPRLTEVVAKAMSDEFCRRILSCAVLRGKTVEEISQEQGVPQSTCYRRIGHLVEEGVMVVERMVVSPTGRKYAIYRSAFSLLDVRLENGVIEAYAALNPAASTKLRNPSTRPDSSCSALEPLGSRHASGEESTGRSGVS
jgi:predicted transcriptional regulator